MSRLHTVPVAEATGESAELFAAIKKAVGAVANAQVTIGTNAPALLNRMLQVNDVLKRGSLSRKELEAINLAVSENSGCEYCLASHTFTGKKAGFTPDQIKKLRHGGYDEDGRLDALVKFALKLLQSRGTVPVDTLEAIRGAGYSDPQITEAIGAISAILFTNMANRVADPAIEFPKAEAL